MSQESEHGLAVPLLRFSQGCNQGVSQEWCLIRGLTGEGFASELTCLLAALRSWRVAGLSGSIPEQLCQPEAALSVLLRGSSPCGSRLD